MAKTKFFSSGPGTQIQLIVTLISVAIAIINFIIVSRLAPVVQNLTDLTTEVKAYESKNDTEHQSFVKSATFEVLENGVSHISGRVDSIYNIVAQIKK